MNHRRLALAAVLAAALAASGCSGPPDPAETPPTFGSEEEAFAAAEATYRAYVDALNQVDLSDPATFEPVFALTTGDANANARRTFSEMHANGWTVAGTSSATRVEPLTYASGEALLAVCLDVSLVNVVDEHGNTVVSPERGEVQSMRITALQPGQDASTPHRWLISVIDAREGEPSCDA